MKLNELSLKPIFIQVAEWTEDEILKGSIKEGDKICSQVELAKSFNINPITAGKGVSLLESRGIVFKKRGLGMFVMENAKSIIYEYRRNEELTMIIDDLIMEAVKLSLTKEQLIEMLQERYVATEMAQIVSEHNGDSYDADQQAEKVTEEHNE